MEKEGHGGKDGSGSKGAGVVDDDDGLPYCCPEDHYHIAAKNRGFIDLRKWIHDNEDDPAIRSPVRFPFP